MTRTASTKFLQILRPTLLWAAILVILAVPGWQAITAGGNPDPLASAAKKSPAAATI